MDSRYIIIAVGSISACMISSRSNVLDGKCVVGFRGNEWDCRERSGHRTVLVGIDPFT